MTIFNRGVRGARTPDGKNIGGISNQFIENKYPQPSITGYTISGTDDTALDPAGGQTVLVNGTGFAYGISATLAGTQIGSVTLVSPTQISFTSPAKAGGSYSLVVYNSTGGAAILVPGLTYSSVPTYTTAAGSIGSYYETTAISTQVVATSDSAITYSLASGSLPSGATLYGNGVITGTSPADSSSTTYTFAITATDAELQDVTRTFTLTINTDVITWSSPANASVTTSYEYSNISNVTLSASSAVGGANVTYSANAVPTGLTLSGNVISGTANTVANTAVLLTATGNATTRTATRTVYFDVQQDSVTWSNPSSNTSISLDGTAYSNTLSATSAAGRSITYTANTLPTGLTLSTATISGTPTVEGTTTTLLTATAATTNRSSQRTITWTVTLGDSYWKYTSLLLNGSTPTTTFINDASLNNNQLTIAGDAKPTLFNPYQNGYYSFYAPTNNDYWYYTDNSAFGTGDFTVELWLNPLINTSVNVIIAPTANNWQIATYLGNFYWQENGGNLAGMGFAIPQGKWNHIACARSGGYLSVWVNGARQYYATNSYNYSATGARYLGGAAGGTNSPWYTSNIHIVRGTALYSGATIAVPTSPLTAVANTVLLTYQSNRPIDNSPLNVPLTANGSPQISSAHPFTTPTTASYNTLYSTYFDGTGDYLTVPDNTSLDEFTDFTIECWVYLNSTSGTQVIVDKGWNGSTFSPYLIFHTNGACVFYANSSGSTWNVASGLSFGTLSAKTWYHIAVSRSSSSIRLFRDGVIISTGTSSLTLLNSTSALGIGGGPAAGANPFNGIISNLRIVKGTAIYTAAFTPPTTSLTAVANTVLLTCQNTTLIDNSTNAFAITSNGQAQPIALSPFTMTTSNTTVTSLGSAYFDGTGDYITTPDSPSFEIGLNVDFTIEAWFYVVSLPSSGNFADIFTKGASGIYQPYYLFVNASGSLLYYSSSTGSSWDIASAVSFGTIALNTWYHVAISRQSTNTRLFLNGVLINTIANSGAALYDNTRAVAIGGRSDGTETQLVGHICDVRLVKGTAVYTANFLPPQTPLTAVANTQLLTCQYNGGANNNGFVDSSSFNNIITRNGNTTQGTFSPYSQTGWSTYFGGSDYLNITSSSGQMDATGDLTMELWIYWNTMPTTGYQNICGNGNIAGTYGLMAGNTASNTWSAPYVFKLNIANSGDYINGNTTLVAGQWYHLAHTRTSGVNRLFVNGVLQTNTATETTSRPYGSGGAFLIGQNSNCYVSNFRYIKGTSLYTATFTPSTSPLGAITNTQLLTCNMNRFTDSSSNNLTMAVSGSPSIQAFSPFGGVTSAPTSYSVYFDGTSDVYTISGNAGPVGTEDFTFEFWAYITTMGGQYPRIFESATSVSGSFQVYLDGGTLVVGGNGTGTVTSYSISALTNQWLHLCVTRTGSAMRLFVNGTLRGYSGSGGTNFASGGTTWRSMTEGGGLIGYLSNMRVVRGSIVSAYSTSTTTTGTSVFSAPTSPLTAISGTQFLGMQSATMLDNSSNYYSISTTGDTKVRPFNPFGTTSTTNVSYTPSVNSGSIYVDGSGDYLSALTTNAMTFGTGDFTVEYWVYPISFIATFQTHVGSSTTSNGFSFGLDGANKLYKTTLTAGASATTALLANRWYHVAWTRSSGTVRAFLNGVQDYTATDTTNITETQFGVAGQPTGTVYPCGASYLSDIRVIKGVSLYNASFFPPASPLTSYVTVGSTSYSSTVLLNGTGGGIIDYHSSNDLETVGNTQLASEDPYGGSYYSVNIGGTPDTISLPSATWTTFAGQFTCEMWLKFNNSSYSGNLFGVQNNGALCLYYNVSSWNPNVYGSGDVFSTGWNPTVGVWYHIAITRNSSNLMSFWVNGTLSGSATTSASYTQGVYFMGDFGASSKNFNVSNFRVISNQCLFTGSFTPSTTPLTTTTVGHTGAGAASSITGTVNVLTCQSNKFVDNSSNNYTVSAGNSPKIKSMNPFQQNTGKSIYFDGTGDSLFESASPNYTFGTGDFTIEFWINFTSTSNRQDILWISTAGAATDRLGISWNLTAGNLTYYISPTIGNAINISWTPTIGQWYYIALCRSSGSTKMFINGTQGGTTYTDSRNYNSQYALYVGQDSTGQTSMFNGYLKDLRITKGYARYTSTFTPPTSTLRAN